MSLDPDLRVLIREQNLAIREVRILSHDENCPPSVTTLLLVGDDGLLVKGRVFENLATVDRITAILSELAICGFPQVVARNGRAVLEPWLEGTVLDETSIEVDHCFQAGRLLGQLHRVETNSRWGNRRAGTKERSQRLAERLQWLVSNALLTADVADRLLDQAIACVPRRIERGFTHRDFCPRNLLIRGTELFSVDNATLNFNSYEEDLARVRCIWPMTDTAWQAFLDGYSTFRSTDNFLRHAGFWIRYTAVARAALYANANVELANNAFDQLERLATAADEFALQQFTAST